MKINPTPVEAYRQAGNQTHSKNSDVQAEFNLDKTIQPEKILLPGASSKEAGSVRASKSPSILSGVLSSEEKQALLKHFARFGDIPESTKLYGTNARTQSSGLTGLKVDLTG